MNVGRPSSDYAQSCFTQVTQACAALSEITNENVRENQTAVFTSGLEVNG